MPDYPAIFRTYIVTSVAYVLAQVGATSNLLPNELRKQALHLLSYALELPDGWPITRQLLLSMAPKMEQAGHREDWMPYLKQGIAVAEKQQDWCAVAECQLLLGLLYRLLSQFELAKEHFTCSINHFCQLDDQLGQARVLNELAWLAYLQRNYPEATHAVEQALSLLQPDETERAISYRVQGMIAIDHERWQLAEALHRQALALFSRSGDLRRMAWSLQNLAYALRGQEKFPEAIQQYQEAAHILQQQQDHYHWALVQMNLGLVYYHAQEASTAIRYFLTAEVVLRKFSDNLQLAKLNVNFGLAFMTSHEYTKAEAAFVEASALFQQIGNVSLYLNARDGLAMAYLAQQRPHQAALVLEAAIADLPKIEQAPNYAYLCKSLRLHLEEARLGK
jgi:tetratricopeptide (TPR) repeat protein